MLPTRVHAVLRRLSLVLTFCAAGCTGWHPNPTAFRVVRAAPDAAARRTALLLSYGTGAALSNTTYHVVVQNGVGPLPTSSAAALARDSAVLSATGAQDLELRWAADGVLEVRCDGCGTNRVDVMERRDRVGAVRVRFVELPRGTAYDRGA